MTLKLEQFGGMLPAWDDRLLPPGQSAFAENSYLFSGALAGWRKPKKLRDLVNEAAQFVYRVPTVTSAIASSNFRFAGLSVAEGDTVTLGEEIYTFTATVTNAYDVLIGGSIAASRDNLLAAFTLDENQSTGIGTKYGTGTCRNPAISEVVGKNNAFTGAGGKPSIKVEAPDFGAAFNVTNVDSSTHGDNFWVLSNTITETFTFAGGQNALFDNTIDGASKWLEFVDPDTSAMRSSIVDDKFGRYYFSDPSHPPTYNTYDRIQADQPAWRLGVPPPGCNPGVTVSGGGDAVQMGWPQSISSETTSFPANTTWLTKITPTAAIELEDVAFMPTQTIEAASFAAVLYDDRAGVPFELINYGGIVTGCTAGTQVTSQFQNPTGLLSGVSYWIGIISDTITPVQQARDSNADNDQVSFASTFTNGPPTFAPTPTTGLPRVQLWGDLTTGSVIASRSYVYTYVTEYGEESPPSPYTLVNGWSNGTWTVQLWQPPPDDVGVLRNVKKIRLYRTITGTGGIATYFFVTELDIGTATYVDNNPDNIVALANELPSTTWFPPPESLYGIQSMPNGMAVGFRGNEVWFCEPYQPHAWPASYVITTEFPIVGIGVTGNAVVVCTTGTPYIAQGVSPASMTLTKTLQPEPCIARGSILSNSDGVYYISPNGLILVTQYGAVKNTTDSWITRTKWKKLTPTLNLRAVSLLSGYFAFASFNEGVTADTDDNTAEAKRGFYIELNAEDAQGFSIWPQPGAHRIGFGTLTAPTNDRVNNVQLDPWTGTGLMIMDGHVYYYDFKDQTPISTVYTWRSKKYQTNTKTDFAVFKIYFEPPTDPDFVQSAERMEDATASSVWNTLPDDVYGIARVYADNRLVTTREIRNSAELLRIAAGFKADVWQFEFTGRVAISNVQAATTVKELAQA